MATVKVVPNAGKCPVCGDKLLVRVWPNDEKIVFEFYCANDDCEWNLIKDIDWGTLFVHIIPDVLTTPEPDLLNASKLALREMERNGSSEVSQRLRAAIAKAEGGAK